MFKFNLHGGQYAFADVFSRKTEAVEATIANWVILENKGFDVVGVTHLYSNSGRAWVWICPHCGKMCNMIDDRHHDPKRCKRPCRLKIDELMIDQIVPKRSDAVKYLYSVGVDRLAVQDPTGAPRTYYKEHNSSIWVALERRFKNIKYARVWHGDQATVLPIHLSMEPLDDESFKEYLDARRVAAQAWCYQRSLEKYKEYKKKKVGVKTELDLTTYAQVWDKELLNPRLTETFEDWYNATCEGERRIAEMTDDEVRELADRQVAEWKEKNPNWKEQLDEVSYSWERPFKEVHPSVYAQWQRRFAYLKRKRERQAGKVKWWLTAKRFSDEEIENLK